MEFPFMDMTERNGSEIAAAARSLYSRQPVLAALYVAVLGVAAVVGTLGNLVVVMTVVIKYLRNRQQHRTESTNNDSGRAFIANLALSDMIVTAVINPLAIAGQSPAHRPHYEMFHFACTIFTVHCKHCA